MKLRHIVVTVTAAATIAATASSMAQAEPRGFRPPSDSLRSYASQIGLHLGVAANPEVLADEELAGIAADEFSGITPENEMKWQVVEPTRGDLRLVRRRPPRRASPRPTVSWCAATPCCGTTSFPDWLTTGVNNGTISNDAAARTAAQAHHRRGDPLQGQDLAVGRRQRVLHRQQPLDDQPERLLGPAPRAPASSPTRSAGPTRPTRRRCCSTTTTTSPAKTAPTPRPTRSTPGSRAARPGRADRRCRRPGPPRHPVRLPDRDAAPTCSATPTSGSRWRSPRPTYAPSSTPPRPRCPPTISRLFAQPYEFSQMLQACLAVRACISFTVWGIGDTDSWVPGWFRRRGLRDALGRQYAAQAGIHDPAAGSPPRPGGTTPALSHSDPWRHPGGGGLLETEHTDRAERG